MEGMQKAVKWYPPSYDIRVEHVPIPKVQHPDDVIVKVQLAGLCGSDLHIYRGHEDVDAELICGHEFVGTVVEMGGSFGSHAQQRPELYRTLRLGDKVVSPFTVSCGECHFCRVGFTCRCMHSVLFGIPALPGGQAQYVRVPKAGGTLFKVESVTAASKDGSVSCLADSSLLLLADILPTGVFAALQVLQHAKTSPMLTASPYPFGGFDRILTLAIVGLGPVGVCAAVSLLDMLSGIQQTKDVQYRVVAIDPNESRRAKMTKIAEAIGASRKSFAVADIPQAKRTVSEWTSGIGCNAILEVVGNNSALELAYGLVRPFGSVSSVGVHQEPPLPFMGRDLYNKNISFDFGRCPVRAMLPIASKILAKYQAVFGSIGEKISLIERVVSLEDAPKSYELFDKGKCGKILFDPWK
ncbi:uncharacterized protein PHACADRAFT_116423 [Phanerochaete carnosa HHB-10118-sp]|uniref:Enoyl reductase (ER) domain-containing protein n=1 Tax=Phanerochaete carnosa (strain HHB-10118-sp) TaxID=650164 RepID=K5X525_PHACS|nr:uncharacterized protein PHACADRAFT_116423 [Phanerochaete carnosa HHB-10118-sp]EKM57942.1 hypothetical protein PHACADRAFT_116423 [Phanerochaete carnosa HHB-10118-sp]